MTYPLERLTSLGPGVARMLKSVGIRTTGKLLESAKTAGGRKKLSAMTGYDEAQLLRWANLADRMRIRGVREPNAELLRAAGVDTIKELRYRNPKKLAEAMKAANERRRLVQILPSEKVVERWIEDSKKLPSKISY